MRTLVVAACVLPVFAADRASAQTAGSEPRFEVASVKPGTSPADVGRAMAAGGNGGRVSFPFFGVRTQPGGRLQALASLEGLILTAYGIKSYQIEGGPNWLATDYFEIAAKSDRETATDAELFAMLRSLLAERFGLRVHVETRPATIHTLTVSRADGRLGPNLKQTSPDCVATIEERKRTGERPTMTRPGPDGRMTPTCGMTSTRFTARTAAAGFFMGGQPFTSLVERISNELNAPVLDRTGLTGLFDVALEYETTRRPAIQLSPALPPPGPDPNSTDPLPVPLPQALQQQLGLKLEKATGPLPITIVDAAEHPSPN